MVREEHGIKQNNTNIPKNRISYSYNSSGNRIKCQNTDFENSSNSRVTDYTYDSANRLTSKSETSANSTSNSIYTYDLSGNLLTGTTTEISGNSKTTHSSTYSYDSLNRTSSVTKDGVTSDYTYDENNRRISKSVGNGTTLYYWNNDQMLCEFNSGNVSQCNYYVWGIGNEAEGMMKNGVPYSNMLNLTGDIVCTIGQTNQTEIETQYDAYGNILGGSTLTSFGYTGEYMDTETGLYYLSARFYDPELGRFTQEDDWLTEGPNLYIYCKNNPVLFSDPSGHCNAVDLVYYRRKGDIATLEKLKRLIANGDCDPRYHYDPDEVRQDFIYNTTIFNYASQIIKLASKNYAYNSNFKIDGLIYNQNIEPINNMRFGIRPMSYNGCEIIAMYNAAYLLGNPMKLQDIAYDMEFVGSMLYGEWGTNPFAIGPYMKSKGFLGEKTNQANITNASFAMGTVYIISFFNEAYNPFSQIHTIAILVTGKNCFYTFNNDPEKTYRNGFNKSIKEVLAGGSLIVAYKIGYIYDQTLLRRI